MEITTWQKNTRKAQVVVINKESYVKMWKIWWKTINPFWRELERGHLKLSGTGNWSCMFMPGRNGFLNIIGGVVALHECMDDTKWQETLEDLEWTIGRTLVVKLGGRYIVKAYW